MHSIDKIGSLEKGLFKELPGQPSGEGRLTHLHQGVACVCAKIASAMQCIFENQWTSNFLEGA
jgi:hypothetical protein